MVHDCVRLVKYPNASRKGSRPPKIFRLFQYQSLTPVSRLQDGSLQVACDSWCRVKSTPSITAMILIIPSENIYVESMIEIIVGSERQIWWLSEDRLCTQSIVFKNALQGTL